MTMRIFHNISISYKTLIPPVIVMLALGAALLFTIRGFDKQREIIRQVNDTVLERSTLLNRFILLSERVQSDLLLASVMGFMGVPDQEVLPVINGLDAGLSNLGVLYHQILSQWPLDKTEKETLKQMKVPLDGFRKQARQSIDTVLKNPSFGILLVRSAALPFAQFRTLLLEFLGYQKERVLQAENLARQKTDRVKTTASVIASSAAFMAILVTAWIGRTLISRPVRSITDVIGQLANGNLSAKVSHLGRRDEIGSMARAVEVFRENALEKQKAEEALKISEINYRTIFDTANDAFFIHDLNSGEILDVNRKMCEMYGYTREESLQIDVGAISEGAPPYSQSEAMGWMQKAAEGTPQIFEWKCRRKTGELFWVEINLKRITIGNEDRLLAVVRDIGERKADAERIIRALEEKEVLLREVHHRVKNNLQVITSLLRLQSDTIKDQKIAEMFQESRERIRSMALIHEKLYRSEDLASIDFNGYIKGLITGLFRSHGTDPGRIATRLEIEAVPLELDQAIPCGLIVNELVSNSLKYAFTKERKGEISVTLRSHGADEVALTVSDDGGGIPENVNFKNADTLGMELVSILAEDQLEGNIDLDRTNGTTFRICFRLQTRRKV
jgi:PAS domain S-box-containing protein